MTPVSSEQTARALDDLLEALPRYFGLAVALGGEEDEFNAAESQVAQAYLKLCVALNEERA
jgi:hypothetical protein